VAAGGRHDLTGSSSTVSRLGVKHVARLQEPRRERRTRPRPVSLSGNHRKEARGMDWKEIDRLREPGFTEARRGYDRREVDRFLGSLVDWLETDAVKELGDLAVKRKLEFVGKSTARILLTTEEESEKMLGLTQEECADVRARADAASLKTREAADEYAKAVRAKADEDARQATKEAQAEAAEVVREGEMRRVQIEETVRELEARRDRALEELERLRGELGSTLGTHKPEPKKPAAKQAPAKEADAVAKT
jgi:DivIVA domain-containing protein